MVFTTRPTLLHKAMETEFFNTDWINHQMYTIASPKSDLKGKKLKFPLILDPKQSPNGSKTKEKSTPSKKLPPNSSDLTEEFYDSVHIKIPADLASLDFVIKSLKQHRRTVSINDLNHSFLSSPCSVSSDIVRRSTSERWIFDSIEKRKLPKGPLNFHASKLDFNKSRVNYSSELVTLFSCLDDSASAGVLRSVRNSNGKHSFEFSVLGEKGEIYVADPIKVNYLNERALDCIYLFHKGPFSKRGSNSVGLMKVSSSLVFSKDGCNYVETEFSLIGSTLCSSCITKSKGLKRKILEISQTFNKSKSIHGGNMAESCVIDESAFMDCLAHNFPSNFELTAIVTRNYQCKNWRDTKEHLIGGWGLNFLKKDEKCGEKCKQKGGKSAMDLNVLIPSGIHGGLISENGGPLNLIERWRAGGKCDCGGWDIGCPITVLKNSNFLSVKENLSHEDTGEVKSTHLFVQGSRQSEPVVKLVNVQEGLHFIYFQKSTLSALQCFSIGIALVHAQISSLSQKM